jgi:hypothetical protein
MRSVPELLGRARVDLTMVAVSLFSAVTLTAAVAVTQAPDDTGSAVAPLALDEELTTAEQRPRMSYEEALRLLAATQAGPGASTQLPAEAASQPALVTLAAAAAPAAPGAEPELQPVPLPSPAGEQADEGEPAARPEVVLLHMCTVDPGSEGCKRGDRVTYEPATEEGDPPAVRVHRGGGSGGSPSPAAPGACAPEPGAPTTAAATSRALRARYLNDPAALLADGYVVTPVSGTRWFHATAPAHLTDDRQLDPTAVETLLYGPTAAGLAPVAALYVSPAAPTTCAGGWTRLGTSWTLPLALPIGG